jgi:hypothetical protein
LPQAADLEVRPEGFGDTLKAMVGLDDIDFESEEFSRRFYVTSGDRKFAYDVIHPKMMEFLLARPCGRLELGGCWAVLCDDEDKLWEPGQIEAWLVWLQAFVELWPDYLVKDLGSRYAQTG